VADQAADDAEAGGSVTDWTASEISPTVLPMRALSIPGRERSLQASRSRWASADRPDRERPGRVRHEPVERHPDVDREDSPFSSFVGRDPVDDHRIRCKHVAAG